MKKIMILIILVAAMFVLAGCGDSASDDGDVKLSKVQEMKNAKGIKKNEKKGSLVGHAGDASFDYGNCPAPAEGVTCFGWADDNWCDLGCYNAQCNFDKSAAGKSDCGCDNTASSNPSCEKSGLVCGADNICVTPPPPKDLTPEEKALQEVCQAKGCPLNYVGDNFCDDNGVTGYGDDCFNKECNWDTKFGEDPLQKSDCLEKRKDDIPTGSQQACVPNSKSCTDDSGSVLTCKADGSGFSELACDSGKTCSEGACVAPLTCNVGESVGKKCVQNDNDVWFYAEHELNSACEASPKLTDGYISWADHCDYTCDASKGGCNNDVVVLSCEGSNLINETKTTWDPKVFKQTIDCTTNNYDSVKYTCYQGTAGDKAIGCATCGASICEATVAYNENTAGFNSYYGVINVGDKISDSGDCTNWLYPQEAMWKKVGTVSGTGC